MDAKKPEQNPYAPSSLSLVLPAYNEEQVIGQAIAEADEALSELSSDYEILVVDDGSSDSTAAIVRQEAVNRPAVRLLQQPENMGYGAALARGFRESDKELVAFTDSDCQFDLSEISRLIELSKDYDIVCGYRIDRQDHWIRKLYSGTYNAIVRILLGTHVRDSDCAMKVFRRDVIQSIDITTTGFFVNSEILSKARMANRSIIEVGVTHRPRPRGESTVSVLHSIPVIKSILRFWWSSIQFPQASSTDAPRRWDRGTEFAAGMLLLFACLVTMLPNLSYPLIEPDETRYVQIALEMTERGDWITPTLDGVPYLDKPPLLYWLTAASVSILGPNEFAVRLPPVLCAIGTILLTFLFGRLFVGSRAGWCGAIGLLLSGGFVLAGRFLIMDSLLTLCTTACLLTGYLAVRQRNHLPVWWIISGIACALGVLTKGPIALILCAPPLIANGWLRRDQTRTRFLHWVAFTLPIAIVCLPWYVAVWASNPDFGEYFFWEHNVSRFAGGANHQQPWWFYVPVLFVGMFPISLLLPTLCAFLFGRSESRRGLRSPDLGFLFCSAAWIVGFFSLASCKLPTYILPAMPLICLMLGSMLDKTVFSTEVASRITSFLKPFPQRATLIVCSFALVVAFGDLSFSSEFNLIPYTAIVLSVAAVTATIALWNRPLASSQLGWGATAAVGIGLIGFTSNQFVGTLATTRSVHAQSAALLEEDPRLSVVFYRVNSYGSSLYLPKNKVTCFDRHQSSELVSYLDRNPRAIVVTPDDSIDSTRQAVGDVCDLVPIDGRGHVYLSYPTEREPTRIARAFDETR